MQSNYKPGSVHKKCVCHLSGCNVTVTFIIVLPSGALLNNKLKRTTFNHRYTWTFIIRGAQPECHHSAGSLLHYLLTLTHYRMGGNFLLHYFALTNNFPLRSGLSCVARTFLLYKLCTRDRPFNCILPMQS